MTICSMEKKPQLKKKTGKMLKRKTKERMIAVFCYNQKPMEPSEPKKPKGTV